MRKTFCAQRGFSSLIIIGVIAISIFIGAFLFLKSNQPINVPGLRQSKEIPQNKRLILLQSQNKIKVFKSIDLSTKQKRELFRLGSDMVVNEAQVSPDGQKFYYIPSKSPDFPSNIVVFTNKGEKREFNLTKNDLWSLSSPGTLTGGMSKDCFWSLDGNKLACMLIQRGSSRGAATGRDKIVVLDYTFGSISEVFNSDQIGPPKGSAVLSVFGGWVDNNKLLYVQTQQNIVEIEPANFYTIDIKTGVVQKEFSYPYGGLGFKIAISPSKEEVFFQSFSRTQEDKFIKYDMNSRQDTVLVSTKDVLGTTHPVISEDGSKLIFTTYLFLKSPQEIDVLKPETLKGVGRSEIHLYDLTTNKEEIIRTPESIDYVEALLPDNKTFIVHKTPENSVIFDSETSSFEELNGFFLGFGYF